MRVPKPKEAGFFASATSRLLIAACATTLTAAACTGGSIEDGQAPNGASPGGKTPNNPSGSIGGGSMTGSNPGMTGGGAGGSGTTGTSPPPAMATCVPGAPDPGEAPLRLLSQEQYLNTINDLFGKVNLDAVYARANNASSFGFAQGDIDLVALENYQRAANIVAAAVTTDKASLDKLAPCTTMDTKACARAFVQSFGAKLYRAPVATADVDRHMPLFDTGVPVSYAHGIEMVLRGMLQSPRFLYRVELGTGEMVGSKAMKLSGHEVAARLSYGLWKTTPDEALRQAAERGELSTREGVAKQLTRMAQDPRGRTMVPHFLEAWIHLGDLQGVAKDATRFPEWNEPLRTSMVAQARTFFDDIVQQGGLLNTLLTSSTTFVDRNLASFYGMDGAGIADATFQKTQRAGFEAGFLALPAFLATQAKAGEGSPIYRGKFVRELLLCQELPPPPPDVPAAPDIKPGVSTRERLAEHVKNPSCAGCHRLIDPVGLGFEHYDGLGRYRTMDAGKPVNASGELLGTDVDGPFTGVPALAAKLAKSADVQACMARQWFRYAMGRVEQPADVCSVDAVLKAFRDSGNDLRALPLALVQTDAFLYRRPMAVAEVKK